MGRCWENGRARASPVIKLAAKQKLKWEKLQSGKAALIKRAAGTGVFCIRKSRVRLEGLRRLVLAFPRWYLWWKSNCYQSSNAKCLSVPPNGFEGNWAGEQVALVLSTSLLFMLSVHRCQHYSRYRQQWKVTRAKTSSWNSNLSLNPALSLICIHKQIT